MMDRSVPVIDVDANGCDPSGDDFSEAAAPQAIAAGLVLNVPVLLRYPDGRQVPATQVRVTPKGLEEISRTMGLDEGRRH